MLGSHARAERTVLHRLSHLRFAHNNEELAEAILVEADWIRTKSNVELGAFSQNTDCCLVTSHVHSYRKGGRLGLRF